MSTGYPPPVQPHRRQQPDVFVRSVMAANLAADLTTIRSLLPHHPFVTIHADYPGCDAPLDLLPPSVRQQDLSPAARYALAKIDIDALPLLHLGITICGYGGRLPVLPSPWGPVQTVWQIGFHGEPDGGQRDLISLRALAAMLFATGVVAAENHGRVTWVAFGGLYHFGFLLKILTGGMPLPDTHQEFSAMLAGYLGRSVFDAKYIATKLPMCASMDGDLTATAKLLDAPAVAEERDLCQAGDKSLAACQVFMRMTALFFAWHGVWMHASRIHGVH